MNATFSDMIKQRDRDTGPLFCFFVFCYGFCFWDEDMVLLNYWRDYFKDHDTITKMEMIRILNENAPFNENNRFQKIIITREKLKEYFPVFYTKSQMEKVLFDLLGEWKKMNVQ